MSPRRKTPRPIEHGTPKGFRQHKHRREDPCEPCLTAYREDREQRYAARAQGPGRFASPEQAAWYGGDFALQPGRSTTPADRTQPAEPLPEADPERGVPVYGRELAEGDVLVFLGRVYKIDRFEPYRGSLKAALGEGTRTAYSGDWGATVGPTAIWRILPREAA